MQTEFEMDIRWESNDLLKKVYTFFIGDDRNESDIIHLTLHELLPDVDYEDALSKWQERPLVHMAANCSSAHRRTWQHANRGHAVPF